jgi:hypothetical protein
MWDSTTVPITAMRFLYQGTTKSCRNQRKIDFSPCGFAFLLPTRLAGPDRDLTPGIRTLCDPRHILTNPPMALSIQ